MNKFRALLMGFAATVGAGGIAAYNGVFDRTDVPAQNAVSQPAADPAKSETPASAPVGETPKAETPVAAETPKTEAPANPPAQETAKVSTEATPAAPATEAAPAAPAAPVVEVPPVVAPTFDVLRVEPDGSVLIAGKAGENAQVEVLSGADVLGVAKAQANGDFAITLNEPLKPGDYQLVLRTTGDDGKSANSAETATVSVPQQKDGPVLALVEEAGKPSRIITAPETPKETVPEATQSETKQTATAEVAVAAQVKAPEAPAAPAETVVIEAVETEDGKIFVAGSAKGVATVRIYANDQALGDAKPGEGDRFLGEFQKELAPGDYIFKAEGLAADGVTVVTRATVPFQQLAAQTEAATPAETAQANANATPSQPEATAQAAQAPAAPKPMAVIIRRGDTLWQISRRIYGRGVRYSTIYLANEGVTGDPNRIFPGQVFKVPEKTPEGEAADAAEVEKRAAP